MHLQTQLLTLQDCMEIVKDAQTRASERSLLSRLTIKKWRLIDRIMELPAIDITKPLSHHKYQPPAPIPSDIRFRKTKIQLCIEEFKPMIRATLDQLDLLFLKLNRVDGLKDKGLRLQIMEDDSTVIYKICTTKSTRRGIDLQLSIGDNWLVYSSASEKCLVRLLSGYL